MRVRSRPLLRLMRSDSMLRRSSDAATVAMAGEVRRWMKSRMLCVPRIGFSRSSSMRARTSAK